MRSQLAKAEGVEDVEVDYDKRLATVKVKPGTDPEQVVASLGGKYKGELKITKRGPGVARQYLYMAVLRQLKEQPIFRAWYDAKVKRDGGLTEKALTALMRKLAGALWWVARGHAFDPSRLFDTSRLSLATSE